VTCGVLIAALLGAFGLPLLLAQATAAPAANDLAAAERLYLRSCASCHGAAGEGGKGPALSVPRLSRATDPETLLTVIRRGVEGTEMPGTRFSESEARLVSEWVLRLGQRPREHAAGDARRGARLYQDKGGCASCHSIKGDGGAFGPDLSDIGRRRGPAHLRQSLLQPDADVFKSTSTYRSNISITENFLHVRVMTRGGMRLQGVRVNEDSFSIQFRDVAGSLHSFFKSELLEFDKDWGRSPMPPYGHVFSSQELDDIVAFMLSLHGT